MPHKVVVHYIHPKKYSLKSCTYECADLNLDSLKSLIILFFLRLSHHSWSSFICQIHSFSLNTTSSLLNLSRYLLSTSSSSRCCFFFCCLICLKSLKHVSTPTRIHTIIDMLLFFLP